MFVISQNITSPSPTLTRFKPGLQENAASVPVRRVAPRIILMGRGVRLHWPPALPARVLLNADLLLLYPYRARPSRIILFSIFHRLGPPAPPRALLTPAVRRRQCDRCPNNAGLTQEVDFTSPVQLRATRGRTS